MNEIETKREELTKAEATLIKWQDKLTELRAKFAEAVKVGGATKALSNAVTEAERALSVAHADVERLRCEVEALEREALEAEVEALYWKAREAKRQWVEWDKALGFEVLEQVKAAWKERRAKFEEFEQIVKAYNAVCDSVERGPMKFRDEAAGRDCISWISVVGDIAIAMGHWNPLVE